MGNRRELQEIGHTGGKVTFNVKVSEDGHASYQINYQHSRPTAAAIFAVYAIAQGIAVADITMGGVGQPWNAPPVPGCFTVFIASDSAGMFGFECPGCHGYWRSDRGGKICPYCAIEVQAGYQFLTKAQRRYVQQYCETLAEALDSGKAGQYTIDMDAVAQAAGKDIPKPAFYYAEEQQQNLFECRACGTKNDVLGTYAYCCFCGTRNDLQEIEKAAKLLRDRINNGGPYEACARDAVAMFDSFAGQYAKQFLALVPMTLARRARLERAHFHNLATGSELLRGIFDINLFANFSPEEQGFISMMFHRRHVYEHKGGEADETYIKESGDAVRVKQALRETQESAHRTVSLVVKLAKNLHDGFHELFPPKEANIKNRRPK